MKSSSSAPVFLFTSAPVATPIYAALAVLMPTLAALAPMQIEAWATAMFPTGAPAIVHLYLYHRGALPPPPSYVPESPAAAATPAVAVPLELPAETGLIAHVTLVANQAGAPSLIGGSPVLGPGAPRMPAPLGPVGTTVSQRAEAVAQVGDWLAYYVMANGHNVPWAYTAPPSTANLPATPAPCPHAVANENTALLSAAHEENRRLRSERKALCFLCLLCCCCH